MSTTLAAARGATRDRASVDTGRTWLGSGLIAVGLGLAAEAHREVNG